MLITVSKGCLPPQSKPAEKLLEETLAQFRKLGTTFIMSRWAMSVFYTCDSLNIKQILAGSFEDFGLPDARIAALSSFVGDGIFTLDNEQWYHTRVSLKPMVAKVDKEAIHAILEHNFQAALRLIPTDNSAVDLQDMFFRLVMDFATEHLTGNSARMLSNDGTGGVRAKQFVADYLTCSTEVIARLSLGPLQHFRVNRTANGAKLAVFRFLDSFIDDSLRKRAAEGLVGREDFLSQLMAMTTDRKVLRNQLLHILVATRDTVASTLSNMFFMLARSPQAWEALRLEVMSTAGTEAPTAGRVKQIKYVRWCINEFMFNMYAMHRDERVFGADVEAFKPERWENLRPGWAYLPFSGGPRICMGQHIALTVIQYILVRMAQTFSSIEGVGADEWVEQYALATTCRGGVHVKLQKA
ncbi:cytochrome P450 [Purpureocillium lavendulum]|uniref:Cytochrome P450 n=1 Tax=Purpureocillium lavendulum TaxID=1247861 RepID=A0AB34FN47_9HYPO|nr:cytochrome P450 [Purpureocillium lavendulum]